METKWPLSTLGEHIELATGEAFKSAEFTTNPSLGTRLARGDNVKEGAFEWGEKSRYWPSLTKDLEKYLLKEDDILLGMDGSKVGKNWVRVRKDDLPCLLVQRVARLRAKQSLDQIYLRYLIGNEYFRNYVEQIKTGSAIPHISGGQIRAYQIPLPPLHEQRRIAGILGALDDKIELNRKMNETLEQLASTLFRSWLVDFDPVHAKATGRQPAGMDKATADLFPDSFVDSEMGKIPEGWKVLSLDEIAHFLNGLALQKYPPSDGPTLPVIKIAQLRKGDTTAADRCDARLPSEYVIEDGDVLFSWSGSLEVEVWCGGKGALNQHLFKVTSAEFPKWFYYLWTRWHLEEFRRIAAYKATTMGHIQRGHLTAAKVITASNELLGKMTDNIAPIIDRIVANNRQSRTLCELRDSLLPKLLSGEHHAEIV